MKEYGHLLGTPEAGAFAARVEDFSEWLARTGVPETRRQAGPVIVQDPCHLRHVQKAHLARPDRARRVRTTCTTPTMTACVAAPAAPTRRCNPSCRARSATARSPRCSGPAPMRPGAVVVSANPGCLMHLRAAGLDVRHPADLLAEALDAER